MRIRIGHPSISIEVLALSERRGPAAVAMTLYKEDEEGRKAREAMQVQMKAAQSASGYLPGRPTKKDRRDIEKVRRKGMS